MEKIAVIGLGIIGGSICAGLKSAGYAVDGYDIQKNTVEYAKSQGYIDGEVQVLQDYGIVIIALPPRDTMAFLCSARFKENALVADICGVKGAMERAVYCKERNYRYIGLHPMAGKERSGIQNAAKDLFQGANLIITVCDQTQQSAIEQATELSTALGFGKIVCCTADEHDRKIALTSQLAHIVSNAYVKSEEVHGCEGFTGGSFQDMTRIAGVDERIWTDLYLFNRENVLNELSGLIFHLERYKIALENGDAEELAAALKEGRLIREGEVRLARKKE
ncbi:MAG: prephenate dehydrogenase/arogenate dehydrogenase family protein [Clostridia bacterium]|nr:prephenate dehydrogenase/arogenate dehydrogenase family protein [Clostridia bacterium]